MRNDNCCRLHDVKNRLLLKHNKRSGLFACCCVILSSCFSVVGCQRLDRLYPNEIADSFSIKEIPAVDETSPNIPVPAKPARPSLGDSKRERIGDLLKSGKGFSVRVRDDQPPKASSIVATKHPDQNLAEEIQSLSPEFKKLLQEYLASSGPSKTASAIATSEQPTSTPQSEVSSDLANHTEEPKVERRNLKSDPAKEPPAVITASAQEPVHTVAITSKEPAKEATPDPENWNESLSKAISVLEKQIRDNPNATEDVKMSNEYKLRMLQLAAGNLDASMQPIGNLTAREQEYLRHQLHALHDASNPAGIPVRSKLWSTVMQNQREATNQLAAISDLEVRSAAFCTSVEGYGIIKQFANYQFKPDQDVLLYCELENVDAQAVQSGFETQLQGRYEIIDNDGKRIADQLLPMEKEVCKNHRRDYFIVYRIYMPMQIPPGSYQLRLTIEDMKAKKYGQSMLDFQIAK
jgi:hypothetical protein